MRHTLLASVFVAVAVLAAVADAAHAQQPVATDPAAPSFRDERRWTPKKAPDRASTATPPATGEPAKAAAVPAASAPAAPSPTPPPLVQKAAVTPPPNPVVKKLAAGACGVPETKTEPLAAGRMQLTLVSSCRAGQEIVWSYGGAEFAAKLDAAGKLDVIVDCFAGATTPVDMTLADGTELSLPVTALDLDKVTKVAVIWRAAVDLDLHAFEYAAQAGEPGHVWSGGPGSLDAARERLDKASRGAGFLSTAMKLESPRDKLEVYTFLHRETQVSGQIGIAVDHATRGAQPTPETCGSGTLAEVPFRIIMHSRRGQLTRTSGLIASATCDTSLESATRFATSVIPPLRLRP